MATQVGDSGGRHEQAGGGGALARAGMEGELSWEREGGASALEASRACPGSSQEAHLV